MPSKVKAVLRALGARTVAALRRAIRYAAKLVTPENAVGWIHHVLAQLN